MTTNFSCVSSEQYIPDDIEFSHHEESPVSLLQEPKTQEPYMFDLDSDVIPIHYYGSTARKSSRLTQKYFSIEPEAQKCLIFGEGLSKKAEESQKNHHHQVQNSSQDNKMSPQNEHEVVQLQYQLVHLQIDSSEPSGPESPSTPRQLVSTSRPIKKSAQSQIKRSRVPARLNKPNGCADRNVYGTIMKHIIKMFTQEKFKLVKILKRKYELSDRDMDNFKKWVQPYVKSNISLSNCMQLLNTNDILKEERLRAAFSIFYEWYSRTKYAVQVAQGGINEENKESYLQNKNKLLYMKYTTITSEVEDASSSDNLIMSDE